MARRALLGSDEGAASYDRRYSQALERGLAVLRCFTPEHPSRGITDISREVGMPLSTTHRYVSTLVSLGYLERTDSRKYRLSLSVTDLGMSALTATGLRTHARPFMEELRRRTACAVSLAVLDRTEILYIDRIRSALQGQKEISLNLQPGSRLPAHCTAMGKVLLAYLPTHEQHDLIDSMVLVKHTPYTTTDRRTLRDMLAQIPERGLANNSSELELGLHAIASPVWNATKEVIAAVGISTSSKVRSGTLADMFGNDLMSVACGLSVRLGYREH
jgi:IclR family transcriptional regulator, pca regulon regulatory protein